MDIENVENLLFEEHKDFTISIVTSEFAVQRGYPFFKGYENSPNFISTKDDFNRLIYRIMRTIAKNVPAIAELIKACFGQAFTVDNLADVVNPLFKLFSAHEHQAAGPEVIDPIIIREHLFTNRDIAEVVNLHKQSVLRPRVVVILKDNDLERAKQLLRFCHHGLRVRMIENKGVTEICKVINTGADDIEQFLDIYARQCFDACSRTSASIITNDEWAEDSSVRLYAPSLLRFRTNVIYHNKTGIRDDVSRFIDQLAMQEKRNKLELGFKCLAHLFRVYCYDYGGEDILIARDLARELDNDILQAHVNRYAHFLPGLSKDEQGALMEEAQKIFSREGMADHSTYCENNRLVNSFYEERIVQARFDDMLAKARSDVPGLVGMATIWNNVGVAYLYNSRNEEAAECFEKGLKHHPAHTQQLGLMCNLLVAKYRAGEKAAEADVRNAVEHSMLHFGPGPFAFLGANNLINLLKACDEELARNVCAQYPVGEVIAQGLKANLGGDSLNTQVTVNADALTKAGISTGDFRSKTSSSGGFRHKFIQVTGFNPAIYNVWF